MGKNLVFMPECHSTNSFAMQLCQQSSPAAEGTVVITANQTAGRGQRGNTWLVEPGKNLTFSIILRPTSLGVSQQFYLSVFTCLAVHDYLEDKGCLQVSIKWPNDVLVNAKKICGILIENQLQGSLLSNTVIGIGLNINQRGFDIDTATSLSLVASREYVLQAELEILLARIEARYLQLRQNDLAGLMKDYLTTMYWLNEEHAFISNNHPFKGTIVGVDQSGRLIVRINNEEKVFGLKEISYVR